eukprot:COSAG01_NODE_10243_length_2211_cov_4.937500_1_plen_552_part_10
MCDVRCCVCGVAAEVAVLCPNLSALFLQPDSKVTEDGLATLRRRCPGVLVSVLGRQLSREQLLGLLTSYGHTGQLDLCQVDEHITDGGLAELAALCPGAEAVFSRPASQITRQGLQAVKAACPAALCLQLGHEIAGGALETLRKQYRDHRVLDLIDVTLFGGITHAGLMELPKLFPEVEAILSTSKSPVGVGMHQLQALKGPCHKLWCLELGRAIDFAAYQTLLGQCSSGRVDLQRYTFAKVGAAGLMEIAQQYPDLVAVFSNSFIKSPTDPLSKSPSGRLVKISEDVLQQVKAKCPSCRCANLGQELSSKTYEELEQQFEATGMLDLTVAGCGDITDAGLAELVDIPGVRSGLEAIFTNGARISADALTRLKEACSWAQCVLLGQEVDPATFIKLKEGYGQAKQLDLSGAAFSRLTVAGLSEIVAMFPDTKALVNAATQVSSEHNGFLLKEIDRLMSAQQSGTASSGRPLRLPMKVGKTLAPNQQDSTFVKLGSLKVALDVQYPARFNLEEILGIGGSGLVVKARDKTVGKVAVKVVTPQVNGLTFVEKER